MIGFCEQGKMYRKRRESYWLAERLTVFKKQVVPWNVLELRARAVDPLRTVYTVCGCQEMSAMCCRFESVPQA